MTYTITELAAAARNAGFTRTQTVIAVAISLAENGARDEHAIHENSNGTYDHGAWQINDVNSDVIRKYGDVNNLQDNARMAYAIYRRQGWRAWTTYNSGAYRANLSKAASVADTDGKSYSPWDVLTGKPARDLYEDSNLPGAGAVGAVSDTADFLKKLSDPAMWRRIGIGALGVFLILIGFVLMLGSNKTVQNISKVAAVA